VTPAPPPSLRGSACSPFADFPHAFVAAYFNPYHGNAEDDIIEPLNLATSLASSPNVLAGASASAITLVSARECVEPTSHRDALSGAQSTEWQTAMQYQYDCPMDNGIWELVGLPADRTVIISKHVDILNQIRQRR
jgi:hypothetical protein